MNRDIFEEFVLRKGYKMGENWAYGMMAEYPVAICSDDHSITVIFRIDPMDARTVKQNLKRALRGIAMVVFNKGTISITMKGENWQIAEKFNAVSKGVPEIFHMHDVHPTTQCSYCKGEGCDVYALLDIGYEAVHTACIEKALDKAKDYAERNKRSGSHLTGTIGALLVIVVAFLVSGIPTWLNNQRLSGAMSLIFAFLPLGIFYTYKLFNGKLDWYATALTGVLSLGAGFFVNTGLLYWQLVKIEGRLVPIADVWALLTRSNMWGSFMSSMIYSLIFTIFALFIARNAIRATGETGVQTIERVQDTLIPIPSQEDLEKMEQDRKAAEERRLKEKQAEAERKLQEEALAEQEAIREWERTHPAETYEELEEDAPQSSDGGEEDLPQPQEETQEQETPNQD